MSRQTWILSGLVLVLIVAVIAYMRLVLVMSKNRPIYDALPSTASLVFEFNDVNAALNRMKDASFGKYLDESALIKRFKDQLSFMEAFINPEKDSLEPTWDKTVMLASLSLTEKEDFDYLYLIQKEGFSEDDFQSLMKEKPGGIKVRKRTFRDESIYEISKDGVSGYLTCAYLNGIFLSSFTAFLVEEAVVQLRDKPSIMKDKGFQEINELSSKDADIIVYLNFPNLDIFQPLLLNDESADLFKSMAQFGGWMELDLKVKNNAIIINGYTGAGKQGETFLSHFSQEPSTDIEVTKLIPENTSIFFYHAVDDFNNHVKNKTEEKLPVQQSQINNFRNWIGNEWCVGLLEPFDMNFDDEAFLIVKSIDSEISSESLKELGTLSGEDFSLAEFKDYQIGQLPIGDELNDLLDNSFLKIRDPYYAVIGDYVVFTNSLSALKTIIGQYREGQTLEREPDYLEFEKNLTSTSNYYVYVNTSRSIEVLNKYLNGSLVYAIKKGQKHFVKFSPVAFQFNYYNGIFFTNGCIQFSSQMEESTNRMWQAKLDAPPAIPPSFVINHYTNDKEIFVQDTLNNIYLITKSGKILWKRQIDSRIMSDINQIDFYENTKLQYVFNTKNMVHVIDRKGEDVADYPLKLPAEASTGMTVVDYDNKRNYRFFVPCKNENIYGFYRSGKPLPGWSPNKNVGTIHFPMKQILIDGKDYLIAANDEGTLYFFNRRGNLRVKPIKLGTGFQTDFYLREFSNTFQLFNVDHEKHVFKVYRNGTYSSQTQTVPATFFDMIYTDLNKDGKWEFIFIDTFITRIFDDTYNEITATAYPKKIDLPGFVVTLSDGSRGLGLVSKADKNIYLTDENYQFIRAFPLQGCTKFSVGDIFDTGRNIVVVGNCDNYLDAYQVK